MKIAQWVKTAATNPDKQSLIPGTRMVGGEHWFLQIVLWLPHTCLWCMCDTHTQQISKRNGYFTRKLWLVALCVFVSVYTCVRIWKPEAEAEHLPCSFSNLSAETLFYRTRAPPQRSSFIFFFKDLYFYVDDLATRMSVHHTYVVPVGIRTPQSRSCLCC